MTIKEKKGAVALISVLIISAVLIISVVGSSRLQLSSSFQKSNNTYSKYAEYGAEACLEEALFRIEADTNFNSGNINSDNFNCTITVSGSTMKSITITSTSQNHTSNFSAIAEVSSSGEATNLTLLEWQET